MSSLSQMRAAVNEQERINNELHRELYALENGIGQAAGKWEALANYINTTLHNGAVRMNNSHNNMVRAYEVQLEIEKLFERYKRIELANKKIRACNNRIYYDFNNYNAVRKVVRALLDNLEYNFVTTSALTKAVEIKHLQLPDYWLTCAVLAIMAWQNDDRVMAERALERAIALDKKSTAIFFFAFYLRLGKDEVAIKWFAEYVACARVGEDQKDILLLFAIANNTLAEECGAETVARVNEFIDRLIKEDLEREGYSEDDLINRIRKYHRRFRTQKTMAYPLLVKYCTDHKILNEVLICAGVNRRVLEFVLETKTVTSAERNHFLNSFIEDVVDRKNTEEIGVFREIKRNELIIKYDGDDEKAEEEYQAWLKHNETEFEMISELVDWVYSANDEGGENVNPTIKKTMFALIKRLIRHAVDADVKVYRGHIKHVRHIVIGEYESDADLSKTEQEHAKIEQYFRQKARELASREKIWSCFIWFGLAVLAIVAAIALKFPALLVGTLVGAIAGVAVILVKNRRKKNWIKQGEVDANTTKDIYGKLSQEYLRYYEELRKEDAYYDRIVEEL